MFERQGNQYIDEGIFQPNKLELLLKRVDS